MTFADLAANLRAVREEIARVQAAEGVSQDVTIVAVTKGHPAAAVGAAQAVGLEDVGENRVQELLAKQEDTTAAVRWHLIGHLQTNKARYVAGRVAMVQSVDSVRVADALAKAVRKDDAAPLPVLVQVDIAGEEQKFGCPPGEAPALVEHVASLPALRLEGLMTMAPFTDDERVQRRIFAGLRELRDRLATPARPLRALSMGMTNDFRAAVAEGATVLRLGTVLFGAREQG